jgi:hypothetical protein
MPRGTSFGFVTIVGSLGLWERRNVTRSAAAAVVERSFKGTCQCGSGPAIPNTRSACGVVDATRIKREAGVMIPSLTLWLLTQREIP